VGGEGASAFGGAWLSPIALPDPSVPLEASFTRPPPVLHLAGDIDEWTYPYLRQVLARAAAAGERRIRVDLADVRYCDVAGLRAIMSLASRQRCGSGTIDQIILEHLPAPLQQLARILGWDATPGVILDGCSC
jgi:anti-anti-sigma factor